MELFAQRYCDLQALLERPKQAVEMITRSLRKSYKRWIAVYFTTGTIDQSSSVSEATIQF